MKQCGNCKWWDIECQSTEILFKEKNLRSYCNYPLPWFLDDEMMTVVKEYDGVNCPTWEERK